MKYETLIICSETDLDDFHICNRYFSNIENAQKYKKHLSHDRKLHIIPENNIKHLTENIKMLVDGELYWMKK